MSTPPTPLPDAHPSLWSVADDWVFLNPGSFGLRLQTVQARRGELLSQSESQPVEFLERTALPLHQQSLDTLAAFLGTDPARLGFVSNATEAIGAVLSSIGVGKGDTILIGDQVYGAVAAACEWLTRNGGQVKRVPVSLPVRSTSDITAAWKKAIADGATLAIVDHVTSGTAIVQPVSDIVSVCRDASLPVLIDGAHAPGMLELNIDAINADWYAGNLHKWVGAPSGAGFLWTADRHQSIVRPLALSHDVFESYQMAFAWQGTRDITPWLVVPDALMAIEQRWGWLALRQWQHDMACWAGERCAEAFGTEVADGTGGQCTGAMVSIALPADASSKFADRFALRDAIASRHRVEVAVDDQVGRWWMRLSFGAWNRPSDVDAAIDAMRDCLDRPVE
ncbi:MAG: aminotransferase class V-fold PLP-dependent enzyme [Phycisphaerales bacterium]|nr:aminotransferase class V-fold PLP-dependent enzyme [Phycisphaerales bacterium]